MSAMPDHARTPGHSRPITEAEMQTRIARFDELQPDLAAFPDLKDPARQRSVSYVISPDGKAGPAAITAPHNFHMAMLEMAKGVRPSTHAHPYNEIFMPLDAKFRFFWGENLEDSVLLGPFDVISVPAGVFRTFENTEDKLGHVMSIFDIAGDPHIGIVVPQELYDKYYQGWRPGMTGTRDPIVEAATRLRDAQASQTPCAPVRDMLPAGDINAAYAVQQLNTELALASGRRLVGRKIGLTAKAVQQQLGVDQPDYGALFADMERGDGDEIGASEVLQPRAEAEVALVLDRDLAHDQPTLADLIRAVAFAVPAIEIVGSRIANWDIGIVDTIADNASSGLYVLGGPARRLDSLDLRACRMTMNRDAELVSQGTGAACLGNPLHAALWLARRQVERGSPLRAGDTIMTGALGPMIPVVRGATIEAQISDLGSVRAVFGR